MNNRASFPTSDECMQFFLIPKRIMFSTHQNERVKVDVMSDSGIHQFPQCMDHLEATPCYIISLRYQQDIRISRHFFYLLIK